MVRVKLSRSSGLGKKTFMVLGSESSVKSMNISNVRGGEGEAREPFWTRIWAALILGFFVAGQVRSAYEHSITGRRDVPSAAASFFMFHILNIVVLRFYGTSIVTGFDRGRQSPAFGLSLIM